MKKIIAPILITGLFLTSCGTEEVVTEVEKTDYNVEVKELKDFSKTVSIQKNGRISGVQDITLNAQANGRVSSISKKEGDTVSAGETVVVLSDTVGNYGIKLEQARNTLTKAQLSLESNEISLTKAVNDTKLALEQAQTKYDTTKQVVEKNLEKAKSDLDTSTLSDDTSKASLDIKTAEANLEKAKFDYQTLLASNQETLASNKRSLQTQYDSFNTLYNNIYEEMDKILGYTAKNEGENDEYENSLGSRDPQTYNQAVAKFKIVSKYKDYYNSLVIDTNFDETIKPALDETDEGYNHLLDLMQAMDKMMKQSGNSNGDLDTVISTVSSYLSSAQSNYNSFVTFKNSVVTFLNTYKDNEKSQKLALDIQEQNLTITKLQSEKTDSDTQIGYDQTVANSEDTLKSVEVALENAKVAYENAQKTKEVTIKQQNAAIVDAQIALKEAQRNYNNLYIKSPINGTISEINVDLGQELSSGTSAFKVVSDAAQEVEISVATAELEHVSVGQKVAIEYQGQTIEGTIESVSKVADANLNYKVIITVDTPVSIIGESVDVVISFESNNHLLPINIVTTTDENKGYINIIDSEGSLSKFNVDFAKIWGNKLELEGEYPEDLKVVLTEIKNYDENKYNLVITNS